MLSRYIYQVVLFGVLWTEKPNYRTCYIYMSLNEPLPFVTLIAQLYPNGPVVFSGSLYLIIINLVFKQIYLNRLSCKNLG